jgi:hypothetical protein
MAAGECLARPTAEHFSMRFEWLHLDGSASLNYTLRVNLAAPSFAQCLDTVAEVGRSEESGAADDAPMLAHLLGVVLVVVLVALGAASARRRHWGRCARAQEAFRRRHSISAAPASQSVSSHESNSSSSAFDASLHETPPNIPFM